MDDDKGPDAYMSDVVKKTIDIKLDTPLKFRNPNLVLMCFDAEGVKTKASELGFAWLLVSDIRNIAPGERCQNWWPFIQARHFLRQKYAKITAQNRRRARRCQSNPHRKAPNHRIFLLRLLMKYYKPLL